MAESVHNNTKATKRLGGITGKGFRPGQSGNPGGKPKKTPITDALREILSDPREAQSLIKAVLKASRRSSGHFKEICERVEGKVSQPIELTGSLELAERMARARKRVTEGK